jgi:hypothetical protein
MFGVIISTAVRRCSSLTVTRWPNPWSTETFWRAAKLAFEGLGTGRMPAIHWGMSQTHATRSCATAVVAYSGKTLRTCLFVILYPTFRAYQAAKYAARSTVFVFGLSDALEAALSATVDSVKGFKSAGKSTFLEANVFLAVQARGCREPSLHFQVKLVRTTLDVFQGKKVNSFA